MPGPGTVRQRHTGPGGCDQPSRSRNLSFQSPHYSRVHSVIEEDDTQTGEQFNYTGDYGSQYTSDYQDGADGGQDFRADGGYFNDGYSTEEQRHLGGIDEYDGF